MAIMRVNGFWICEDFRNGSGSVRGGTGWIGNVKEVDKCNQRLVSNRVRASSSVGLVGGVMRIGIV